MFLELHAVDLPLGLLARARQLKKRLGAVLNR